MWHKPVPEEGIQECPHQGTPATHLKRQWLLWGPSALNLEPSTMLFRESFSFPMERAVGNPPQQTSREPMPANGTGKKAGRHATANPGSSGRLPTEVHWYYSETGFVMLLAYIAMKFPPIFLSKGIVSPGSFQHCTLPSACSKSPINVGWWILNCFSLPVLDCCYINSSQVLINSHMRACVGMPCVYIHMRF